MRSFFIEERKKERIEITERDLICLVVIDKVGMMRVESFEELGARRTIQGRLVKLLEYGYLRREREGLYFPYEYFLTQKGMDFVFKHFYLDLFEYFDEDLSREPSRIDFKRSEHQNWIGRVIIGLIADLTPQGALNALKTIYSDRDMRFFLYHTQAKQKKVVFKDFLFWLPGKTIPDILIRYKDKTIVMEVEISYKGKSRTIEKLWNMPYSNYTFWIIRKSNQALKEIIEKETNTGDDYPWNVDDHKIKETEIFYIENEIENIITTTKKITKLIDGKEVISDLIASKLSVLDTLIGQMNPAAHSLLKDDLSTIRERARKDLVASEGQSEPHFKDAVLNSIQEKINRFETEKERSQRVFDENKTGLFGRDKDKKKDIQNRMSQMIEKIEKEIRTLERAFEK